MNKRKMEIAIIYCTIAAIAGLLTASMFVGGHVYEHEEIEIRRCPQVQDMIILPGWDEPER